MVGKGLALVPPRPRARHRRAPAEGSPQQRAVFAVSLRGSVAGAVTAPERTSMAADMSVLGAPRLVVCKWTGPHAYS